MAMNLESAMKLAEEKDLWIGDTGASSHMMGSEEHVFNKTLISGSLKTADTIPTRNGRELGEIWVSKVGTNF